MWTVRTIIGLSALTPTIWLAPFALPAFGQTAAPAASASPQIVDDGPLPHLLLRRAPDSYSVATSGAPAALSSASLPDAPQPGAGFALGVVSSSASPCQPSQPEVPNPGSAEPDSPTRTNNPCLQSSDPYQRFLSTPLPTSLTPGQKAHLAVHNLFDPGNLATVLGTAAFTIGTNSHTPYGPGWKGFGRNSGYSFVQDSTGEFFGTFLIPTITHEDPHYHRMPHANIARRVVHAVSRTVIAQNDDGHTIPNYSALLTYPICTELTNLYVPGVHGNGPSTVRRILTGYAGDPVDNLVTEFLPDVARRIHVRVIFVQRILNQVASDQYSLP